MDQLELINVILPTAGIMAAMGFVMLFFREWRVGRDRDFDYKKEELKLRKLQLEVSEGNRSSIHIDNDIGNQSVDLGGYVTIEMPDERKSLFHDLLKGFEDYAAIKGYKVSISIDSSQNGKLSFKIAIDDFGVVGTRDSVKNDLNEFIEKIKNGDSLDDLDEVIGNLDHARLIMALKNRIQMLQSHYDVQKNVNEYYQTFFSQLPTQSISHTQPINIYNGDNQMDKRKYISNNSANVMQGDNHSNLIEGNSINIGATLSEKNERVEGLNELIRLLKLSTEETRDTTVRHLENVKEELTEEKTPDEESISKWLGKATGLLTAAEKGSELFNKAQEVLGKFGIEL